MNNQKNIESLSSISKEEVLINFENLPKLNYLILENEAYPGFYEGNYLPIESNYKTKSIFLIIESLNSFHIVRLYRVIFRIKKELGFKCDISPAIVELYNYENKAIRVRLEDLNNIVKIIELLQKEGIKLLKNKKIGKYSSLIHLKKFVQMDFLAEDIYQDRNDKDTHYIALPHVVNIDDFQQINKSVKNNYQLSMFDGARCTILQLNGVKDFARIYSKGGYSMEQLESLKEKFHFQTKVYFDRK